MASWLAVVLTAALYGTRSCSAFVHPNLNLNPSHGLSVSLSRNAGSGSNVNGSRVYQRIGGESGSNKAVLGTNGPLAFTSMLPQKWSLSSSFYNDFEDFDSGDDDGKDDDDDDDDGDDDYIDFDDAAIAKFRSKMGGGEEQTSNTISNADSNPDTTNEEDDTDDEDDDIYDLSSESDAESSSSIPQSDLSSISSVEDLISFATSQSTSDSPSKKDEPPTDWALPIDTTQGLGSKLDTGVVLIANPAKFCTDFPNSPTPSRPSPALLAKFGLTLPPPPELGPDRRADLLPVLLLLERHPLRGCQALLLNRRTGYLIGDLDQQQQQSDDTEPAAASPPPLGAFMIQPLWFGGTSSGGEPIGGRGFDMVHLCPNITGAKQITEDGLYWGGDPAQAQDTMADPGNGAGRVLTGFDFKFFVQSTRWLPTQLEKEIRDGTWILASVSKDVLFKSRDRLGSKRAKPLWTEVMESMGGKYEDIRNLLYGDE